MGLSSTLIYNFRVNSLFNYLCSQCYAAQHSYVPLFPVLACVEDGQFLCNRNSAAGVCDTDYSALELLQSPSQLK